MCPATLARGWLQRLLQCAGETRGRMETEAGVAGSKLCRLPVELLALHPALPSPLPRACLTTPPLRSRPPPLGPRCPAGAAAGADRGVSPAAAGGGQLPSQAARPQHAGGRGAAPPGWAAPPGLAVVLRAACRRPDSSAARRSSVPTRALASTDQPPVMSPSRLQCLYLRGAFALAEGPAGAAIREGLLAGVVEHLISIDVEIRWVTGQGRLGCPDAGAGCGRCREAEHLISIDVELRRAAGAAQRGWEAGAWCACERKPLLRRLLRRRRPPTCPPALPAPPSIPRPRLPQLGGHCGGAGGGGAAGGGGRAAARGRAGHL